MKITANASDPGAWVQAAYLVLQVLCLHERISSSACQQGEVNSCNSCTWHATCLISYFLSCYSGTTTLPHFLYIAAHVQTRTKSNLAACTMPRSSGIIMLQKHCTVGQEVHLHSAASATNCSGSLLLTAQAVRSSAAWAIRAQAHVQPSSNSKDTSCLVPYAIHPSISGALAGSLALLGSGCSSSS